MTQYAGTWKTAEPWRPSHLTLADSFLLNLAQGLNPDDGYSIATRDELWNFCHDILGVAVPRERVCADHAAPFDAFADAYFATHSVSVWKASRGFGGKSFLLALLAMVEQITLDASVNLLGGSGEQSQRVHAYMSGTEPTAAGKFWDAPNAPRDMLITDPTKRETRTTNGGYIKALMASSTSVRGPHPQRLRLDEVDEMKLGIFNAAMGQTMSSRGVPAQTVCSSTHQHADGTMTEVLQRASRRGWPVYEWCYKETLEPAGWLMPSEVERKRGEVTAAMWATEYDLQEPDPEGRAIDPDSVEALFDRTLGHYSGRSGQEIVIIEPGKGDFYTGTDWAKTTNWTVIHTIRMMKGDDKARLAAWLRTGRRPWPVMIANHDRRVKRYGGRALHDETGLGKVIHDYMGSASEGFDFSGRKGRTALLSEYIVAIERGELVYPMIDFAHGEHKYARQNDLYGSGHLPDSIAAGALAWRAASNPGASWTDLAGLGRIEEFASRWT